MDLIRVTWRVALLIAFPALIAWLTGLPFIFPSLGPSAYILASNDPKVFSTRKVIGGHFVGVLAGLAAYYSIAAGLSLPHLSPALTIDNLRVVMSGVCALVLAASVMQLAKAVHPPACATTLLVSLGVLATAEDALIIMGAVTVMFITYKLLVKWSAEPYAQSA
jgi:CBS-domain-containing membrane protein